MDWLLACRHVSAVLAQYTGCTQSLVYSGTVHHAAGPDIGLTWGCSITVVGRLSWHMYGLHIVCSLDASLPAPVQGRLGPVLQGTDNIAVNQRSKTVRRNSP